MPSIGGTYKTSLIADLLQATQQLFENIRLTGTHYLRIAVKTLVVNSLYPKKSGFRFFRKEECSVVSGRTSFKAYFPKSKPSRSARSVKTCLFRSFPLPSGSFQTYLHLSSARNKLFWRYQDWLNLVELGVGGGRAIS